MSENQHDTKFAQFAKLLYEELAENAENSSFTLSDKEAFEREQQLIIAQRAYGLVQHAIAYIDIVRLEDARIDGNSTRVMNSIPDMTEFPRRNEVPMNDKQQQVDPSLTVNISRVDGWMPVYSYNPQSAVCPGTATIGNPIPLSVCSGASAAGTYIVSANKTIFSPVDEDRIRAIVIEELVRWEDYMVQKVMKALEERLVRNATL